MDEHHDEICHARIEYRLQRSQPHHSNALGPCHRVLQPDVDTAHLDHVELRAGHVERRPIGRLAWGWNGAIAVLT